MNVRQVITPAHFPREPWPRSQVVAALVLWVLVCLTGVIRAALMKDWARPLPATLGVVALAALLSLWVYGLSRRQNWLRSLTVGLGALSCLLAPWSVSILTRPVNVGLYWLQMGLTLLATALFTLPAVRQRYGKGNLAA
jgi:hypothetical protein